MTSPFRQSLFRQFASDQPSWFYTWGAWWFCWQVVDTPFGVMRGFKVGGLGIYFRWNTP